MLLTAHFAFTQGYDSMHLRCYCTLTVSFVLYHCTFLCIYVSTAHFAFTPLYDSTHLRCYCTPTVSFVLHQCTFLRIYISTAHFKSNSKRTFFMFKYPHLNTTGVGRIRDSYANLRCSRGFA